MKQKIFNWFKNHLDEIILAVAVFLISLLSFFVGYILGKNELKTPLKIENESSYYWSRDSWALFGPEIS